MVRRKSQTRLHRASHSHNAREKTGVIVRRNKSLRTHMRALQEIKYLRKSVDLIIPKAPFVRVVREVMVDLFPSNNINRMQLTALQALQEAAEAYIVQYFEDCVILMLHAKRKTLMRQDLIVMRRLRGRDDIINR